jgi:hypothetical protein
MSNVPVKGPNLDAIHPIRSSKKSKMTHADSSLDFVQNAFAHMLSTVALGMASGHSKQAEGDSSHVAMRGVASGLASWQSIEGAGTSRESLNGARSKERPVEQERVNRGPVDVRRGSFNHAGMEPISVSTTLQLSQAQVHAVRTMMSTQEVQGTSVASLSTQSIELKPSTLPGPSSVESREHGGVLKASGVMSNQRSQFAMNGFDRIGLLEQETPSAMQPSQEGVEGPQSPADPHPVSSTMKPGAVLEGKATAFLDGENTARNSVPHEKARGLREQGVVDGSFWDAMGSLNDHPIQASNLVDGSQQSSAAIDTLRATAYQDLSNLISSHIRSGFPEITVHVHPEGMGDILISVSKEISGLQVSITATHPQTLQWLERGIPEVIQALQSSGVDVASLQCCLGQSGAFQQSFANPSHSDSEGQRMNSRSRLSVSREETDTAPRMNISDLRRHDWRATTISVQV